MDLMQGLLTRRSVRKYTDKKIEKSIMEEIIRVAQYSPSAHDKRPWEFLVIEDKEVLKEFRRLQRASLFAENAAAVVLVCVDKDRTLSREKEGWSYEDIDGSSATMNLLLAAHAKGIGACWCGCSPMSKPVADVAEKFNLPENIKPFSIVVMGYPEGAPREVSERFDAEKIHWGKW